MRADMEQYMAIDNGMNLQQHSVDIPYKNGEQTLVQEVDQNNTDNISVIELAFLRKSLWRRPGEAM